MRTVTWVLAGALAAACSAGEAPAPPGFVSDAPTRARGHAIYLEKCTLCHGVRGNGRGQRREGLTPAPADFTNPVWRRGADPRRVYGVIHDGKPGTSMPASRSLDDDEIWALVAYVLSIAEGGS